MYCAVTLLYNVSLPHITVLQLASSGFKLNTLLMSVDSQNTWTEDCHPYIYIYIWYQQFVVFNRKLVILHGVKTTTITHSIQSDRHTPNVPTCCPSQRSTSRTTQNCSPEFRTGLHRRVKELKCKEESLQNTT